MSQVTATPTYAYAVKSGYNDINLCNTTPTVLDILWYQLIPHC